MARPLFALLTFLGLSACANAHTRSSTFQPSIT